MILNYDDGLRSRPCHMELSRNFLQFCEHFRHTVAVSGPNIISPNYAILLSQIFTRLSYHGQAPRLALIVLLLTSATYRDSHHGMFSIRAVLLMAMIMEPSYEIQHRLSLRFMVSTSWTLGDSKTLDGL